MLVFKIQRKKLIATVHNSVKNSKQFITRHNSKCQSQWNHDTIINHYTYTLRMNWMNGKQDSSKQRGVKLWTKKLTTGTKVLSIAKDKRHKQQKGNRNNSMKNNVDDVKSSRIQTTSKPIAESGQNKPQWHHTYGYLVLQTFLQLILTYTRYFWLTTYYTKEAVWLFVITWWS